MRHTREASTSITHKVEKIQTCAYEAYQGGKHIDNTQINDIVSTSIISDDSYTFEFPQYVEEEDVGEECCEDECTCEHNSHRHHEGHCRIVHHANPYFGSLFPGGLNNIIPKEK